MTKNEIKPKTEVKENTNIEAERWYGLDEIATHLGVHKDTIRAWIKKNTIPFYKVGRQYKFNLPEVDEWVKSGQRANADKSNVED